MFVRKKPKPTADFPHRAAVQVVASRRTGNKVQQKIVKHLGIGDTAQEVDRLYALGEFHLAQREILDEPSLFSMETRLAQLEATRARLLRTSEPAPEPLWADLNHLRPVQAVVTGFHDVYGVVYRELGLDRLLPRHRYRASNAVLRNLVVARLAQPLSKLASAKRLTRSMGVRVSVEQVYRMMDRLDDARIDRLNGIAAQAAGALLPEPVSLCLFDCTSLYFESFRADELKQPGYSKDAKWKESQVLLAVMVTPEGLPLGYELLRGGTSEQRSLVPAIARLRRRHGFAEVTCVADRGMMSQGNRDALRAADVRYVIGEPLKRLPNALKERILDPGSYRATGRPGERVAEFEHAGRRLVVMHSERRAQKDADDRTEGIQRLLSKLEKGEKASDFITNSGYKRFLKVDNDNDSRVHLDPRKVQEAARWDGLHGVSTDLDHDFRAILGYYRSLWQVEYTFRITKHDLRVRPMFHWTPARIKAHVAIAFMTLMCARHLEYRSGLGKPAMSPGAIRTELESVTEIVLESEDDGRRYSVPAPVSDGARRLYRLVNLRPLDRPYLIE